PMSSSTCGSLGCTDVLVMMCQKTVRSRTFWGSVDHGAPAWYDLPRIVRGFGAKALSGLWTMRGSSYMPGTLVLTGSPSPDVLKMMYCALSAAPHGAGTSPSAFCGFKRNEMGSPLAIERSPTPPAPKSIERSALRREIMACSSESNGDRRWRKA